LFDRDGPDQVLSSLVLPLVSESSVTVELLVPGTLSLVEPLPPASARATAAMATEPVMAAATRPAVIMPTRRTPSSRLVTVPPRLFESFEVHAGGSG
jgi:hypothetical protein